mgnify:CR=1 FL=1
MRLKRIQTLFPYLFLCLALAGLAWPAASASAGVRSCRTDPILTFSDGSQLTVKAVIETELVNVEQVIYTVHIPKNLALTREVHTAGGMGGREVVVWIADQEPGEYQSSTLVIVKTAANGVKVKAVAVLNPGTFGAVTGLAGEPLVVNLRSDAGPSSDGWVNPSSSVSSQ